LFILILAFSGSATDASAMDRWSALSMIESGDNDNAAGPGGEISRYQIRRELWSGGDPHDAKTALAIAQGIMLPRLDGFQRTHGRAASDFEFYVLWNAPSQVNHPGAIVADRARRFTNLVQRDEPPPQTTNSPGKTTNAP
jgi:hypothetical protein